MPTSVYTVLLILQKENITSIFLRPASANKPNPERYLDVTSTHKPTTWHSDPHHTSNQHFVHWQFSTVTLQPCDIFLLWHSDSVTIFYCDNFLLRHFDLVTFCYCYILTLWQFSTVTLRPCDIFLLWHSDSVTIFYCNIPSQSGRIVRPPQKVDVLSHCDILTHCNFGQPMAVTFCPLWISIFPVDTLSKLQPILTDDDLVTLSL
jgi:hypothetical protein